MRIKAYSKQTREKKQQRDINWARALRRGELKRKAVKRQKYTNNFNKRIS